MTTTSTTISLELPQSLKDAVEKQAQADGTSLSHFLAMAAAEKLSALQSAEAAFGPARARADIAAALRFLSRDGGEPPCQGDEKPFAD